MAVFCRLRRCFGRLGAVDAETLLKHAHCILGLAASTQSALHDSRPASQAFCNSLHQAQQRAAQVQQQQQYGGQQRSAYQVPQQQQQAPGAGAPKGARSVRKPRRNNSWGSEDVRADRAYPASSPSWSAARPCSMTIRSHCMVVAADSSASAILLGLVCPSCELHSQARSSSSETAKSWSSS